MANKWKFFWIASLAAVIFFQACGVHSWQEFVLSLEDEKKMGREYDSLIRMGHKDVLASGEKLLDPASATQARKDFYEYYQARAKEIVNVIPKKDLDALIPTNARLCGQKKDRCTKENFFEFKLIESKQVNAFAVPGGYIYFYTPILRHFQSESELVSVIAHEVGHVVRHHSRDRIVKAVGASVLIDALLGDGVGGILASLGTNVWLMSNGREDEFEADDIAFEYTNKLGISSVGLSDFFSRGLNIDPETGRCLGQNSSPLDVFSTHPPSCDRVNRNIEKINASGQNYPRDKNKLNGLSYKQLADAAAF